MSLKVSSRPARTLRVICNSDAPCAFTGYHCSLARLDGYEYCICHILEDKTAPFRQCSYVFTNYSKKCFRAAPASERKESYCAEHSREALRKRQKLNLKQKPTDTPEYCLNQLSHHYISPLSTFQNAIPDPASVPSVASTAIQHTTPDEDNTPFCSELDVRLLPRAEDDSELDSAESDAEPLEHAGIFTTEEASNIYLEKLHKLKTLYTEEYKRLWHLLKENRREYLQTLRVEKETMMSIHAQPKENVKDREAYKELKALARYHRHFSKEALLHKHSLEKRIQSAEGVITKPSLSLGCVKCIYSEGSWRCGAKSVPLSKYCFKHIMQLGPQISEAESECCEKLDEHLGPRLELKLKQDERQVLFRPCGSLQGGGEECEVPVIPLPHTPMCVYHTPLPHPLPVSDPPIQPEPCVSFSSSHPRIIDFSDSSALIISEIPPENVMEGDSIDNSSEKDPSTPSKLSSQPMQKDIKCYVSDDF